MKLFDDLFRMPSVQMRHSSAPMAQERAVYLAHLLDTGRSRSTVRQAAVRLLHVVRFLELSQLRRISPEELQAASETWYSYKGPLVNRGRRAGVHSAGMFRRAARRWLKYHNSLIVPERSKSSNKYFLAYKQALSDRFGFAASTVSTRKMHVSLFLIWMNERRVDLRHVAVQHVERYLNEKIRKGWCAETAITASNSIKGFLRFLEESGYIRAGTYLGVPRIVKPKRHFVKKGPNWSDVHRMLSRLTGTSELAVRGRAIALLVAQYGFRVGEIVDLRLGNIDLSNRVLTIKRGKNSISQRFPMTGRVVNALQAYLQKRPKSLSPALFIRSVPPYSGLKRETVHTTIRRMFVENNIKSIRKGPHALRHACADRLMQQGASVYEISGYLGHRRVNSVRFYVQYDLKSLRRVADFSLKGLM